MDWGRFLRDIPRGNLHYKVFPPVWLPGEFYEYPVFTVKRVDYLHVHEMIIGIIIPSNTEADKTLQITRVNSWSANLFHYVDPDGKILHFAHKPYGQLTNADFDTVLHWLIDRFERERVGRVH